MSMYRVIWEIDITDADSPEEAACKALEIQRNPKSIATIFAVVDEDRKTTKVDLLDSED